MGENEGRFSKARLEGFSDGVIAVITTIMVLDLKAPHVPDPAALFRLWPSFSIYRRKPATPARRNARPGGQAQQ